MKGASLTNDHGKHALAVALEALAVVRHPDADLLGLTVDEALTSGAAQASHGSHASHHSSHASHHSSHASHHSSR